MVTPTWLLILGSSIKRVPALPLVSQLFLSQRHGNRWGCSQLSTHLKLPACVWPCEKRPQADIGGWCWAGSIIHVCKFATWQKVNDKRAAARQNWALETYTVSCHDQGHPFLCSLTYIHTNQLHSSKKGNEWLVIKDLEKFSNAQSLLIAHVSEQPCLGTIRQVRPLNFTFWPPRK